MLGALLGPIAGAIAAEHHGFRTTLLAAAVAIAIVYAPCALVMRRYDTEPRLRAWFHLGA